MDENVAIYSPSGMSEAATYQIWDTHTGQLLSDTNQRPAQLPPKPDHSAIFDRRGYAIYYNDTHDLDLHEADSHKYIATLSIPGSHAAQYTKSDDDGYIALTGPEGTIHIWHRTREDRWWGIFMQPELWSTLLLIPVIVWSIRRDRRWLSVSDSIESFG